MKIGIVHERMRHPFAHSRDDSMTFARSDLPSKLPEFTYPKGRLRAEEGFASALQAASKADIWSTNGQCAGGAEIWSPAYVGGG
jgi:hypothetical protein